MPKEPVRTELARVIAKLSAEFSAPLFEPHVTLLGELTGTEPELAAKTAQLARRQRPFSVQLGAVGFLDEYYRCLFIRLEETPPLLEANERAREIFGRQADARYMPHLSLLYAQLKPEIKASIIARIGDRFAYSFAVESLYLFSTRGEPKEWYRIGEFSLGHKGDYSY